MTYARLQMLAFSALATVATIGSLGYIGFERPPYLRLTSAGVPYYTPPVINPATGKPLDLNVLVRHYEGKE